MSKITLSNTPFGWILPSLVAGIIAYCLVGWECAIIVPGIAAILILIYRRWRLDSTIDIVRSSTLARWQFALLIAAIGAGISALHDPGSPTTQYDQYTNMQGEIVAISGDNKASTKYQLRVETVLNRSDGRYLKVNPFDVWLYSTNNQLRVGDVVQVPLDIKHIGDNPNYAIQHQPSIFPADKPTYNAFVSQFDIRLLGSRYNDIKHLPTRIRDTLLSRIESSALQSGTRNLLRSLLLADKNGIDSDVRQGFNNAGIAHILAVSGLHVGVIAGLVLLLLLPFRRGRLRSIRYLLTIAAIWMFTMVCGMPASAVRASVMLSICLIAAMLGREYSSVNALCAGTFLILIFDPFALFSASLQFSFVAVFGLITIVPYLIPASSSNHYIYQFSSLVVTTLVISVIGWGLTAFWFGSIQVCSLVANVVVLPLLPCFMGLAILYVLLLGIGIDWHVLSVVLDTTTDGLYRLTGWISGSSVASIDLQIGLETALLFYAFVAFIGIYAITRNHWPIYTAAAMAVLCLFSALVLAPQTPSVSGFIVTTRHDCVEIRHYNEGREGLFYPDAGVSSVNEICGKLIVTISCDTDNIPSIDHCDVLLIGNGFRGNTRRLLTTVNPKYVVLSAGLYKYRANDFVEECDRRGIPCHNISDSGPFRMLW